MLVMQILQRRNEGSHWGHCVLRIGARPHERAGLAWRRDEYAGTRGVSPIIWCLPATNREKPTREVLCIHSSGKDWI